MTGMKETSSHRRCSETSSTFEGYAESVLLRSFQLGLNVLPAELPFVDEHAMLTGRARLHNELVYHRKDYEARFIPI
jgi:hypothetical protein